jgi:putative FmdB family regulatory protein
MPLYDYRCSCCEHMVEDVLQKFGDKPLKKCPECSENELSRLISGGIHCQVKSVKTIGQLADKNYEDNKSKINEAIAKKNEETPQAPTAWHQNPKYGNASSKDINKMNRQQQIRYIMEGKK